MAAVVMLSVVYLLVQQLALLPFAPAFAPRLLLAAVLRWLKSTAVRTRTHYPAADEPTASVLTQWVALWGVAQLSSMVGVGYYFISHEIQGFVGLGLLSVVLLLLANRRQHKSMGLPSWPRWRILSTPCVAA